MSVPDAQECKARAIELLGHANNSTITAALANDYVAEAQVWATLATVPEPLEALEVHGQLIESLPEFEGYVPGLRCPHGYTGDVRPNNVEGQAPFRFEFPDCGAAECP